MKMIFITSTEKPLGITGLLDRLLNICNIKGTVASIGCSLLQKLVQEVPDDLSVCEFGCPMTKCTAKDWKECELRN